MRKGKILVTGGMGYIGSHTIVDLINEGYHPVSLDNFINSDKSVLDRIRQITNYDIKNFSIDLLDLASLRKFFEDHWDIEGIIHFAALKAVGESVEKPIEYFHNNVTGLIHLLMCMKEKNIKNLIFSSSCTVYGIPDSYPVDEETPIKPASSPYGRSKQICENIICDSADSISFNSVMLRYFNPAGAHPSGALGELPINKAANLVPAITETAIGVRNKMVVFGDDYDTPDGSCIRDYIHIMDLARAHTLALEYLFSGKSSEKVNIFNLGNGQGITVLEVIKSFEKMSGEKLNYSIGARRPGDVPAIYADYSKAKKYLGWEPHYNLDEIMESAWKWERNRREIT